MYSNGAFCSIIDGYTALDPPIWIAPLLLLTLLLLHSHDSEEGRPGKLIEYSSHSVSVSILLAP